MRSLIFQLFKRLGLKNTYLQILFFIRGNSHFSESEADFFSDFILKDQLVFDVGANVGKYSNIFLNLGARVIAFEPNMSLHKILLKRFSGNVSFEVINVGLGSSVGDMYFNISDNHLVSTFSEKFISHKKDSGENKNWQKKAVVQIDTLDNLIRKYGIPVFIKIDVEGFEKEVISGLNFKTDYLSFEFTSPTFNSDTIYCIERLKMLGYKHFNLVFGETFKFEFEQWLTFNQLIDFINTNPSFAGICYGDIYCK